MNRLNTLDTPQEWNLSDLYEDFNDPRLAQDLEYLRVTANQFREQYRGTIATLSPEAIADALRQIEAIATKSGCLCDFPFLVFSADTRNTEARQFLDQVKTALTEVSNQLLFFDLELQALDEDTFADLQTATVLESYWHYLDRIATMRPYKLPEAVEQTRNQDSLTGRQAFVQLRAVHLGEQDYAPVATSDGRMAETEAELRALLYHPSADIRGAAYSSVRQVLQQHNSLYGYILNSICQDHHLENQMRGYDSTLHKQLMTDEVAEPVFRAIMDGTRDRYDLFQRYYRLKALGTKQPVRSCDFYAPWTSNAGDIQPVPYKAGVKALLAALEEFDVNYARRAEEFFLRNWVDAKVRPGKRGGAFCCYTHSKHSYLLMSYTEDYDSLFTLAHEMGHGLHYAWIGDRQSYLNCQPPLVLAEVASTFNELLLLDYLLKQAEGDAEMRRSLLTRQLEDQLNLLFRQSTISRLEMIMHDKAATGSFDHHFINAQWTDLYGELCGDAVELLPSHQYDWAKIGHIFFKPFYCYQYTTSTIVSLACYQQYLDKGKDFIPGYLELLGVGSRYDQVEALRHYVGVNLDDPSTIKSALNYVESLLDQLQDTLDMSSD